KRPILPVSPRGASVRRSDSASPPTLRSTLFERLMAFPTFCKTDFKTTICNSRTVRLLLAELVLIYFETDSVIEGQRTIVTDKKGPPAKRNARNITKYSSQSHTLRNAYLRHGSRHLPSKQKFFPHKSVKILNCRPQSLSVTCKMQGS